MILMINFSFPKCMTLQYHHISFAYLVTGLEIWLSILSVGLIATMYTALVLFLFMFILYIQ